MAKIIMIADPKTGQTQIKAEGYSGPVCKLKTKPFEDKLGMVTSDEETPEMYNQETQDETLTQGQ